jgi:glucose-6-phosphate 1-dehydrogenase
LRDPTHVRGQYDGYQKIDGVASGSGTETYVALRLDIGNWRWDGAPIFIRIDKRLPVARRSSASSSGMHPGSG